jgi:hypothetical protein
MGQAISFILGVAWIIAFFVLHLGPWSHVLLAIAVVITMAKMAKNPVR